MTSAALELVTPDGPDIRARHAAHLDNEQIIEALCLSAGIVTEAARSLRISRDTLHERLREDAALRQALSSIREQNLDLAEGQLLRMIKEGDGPSVRFYLRTLGRHRGYSERLVVEQPPEPAPRHNEQEIQRRLRALSKAEFEQLEVLVNKMEGAAGVAHLAPEPFDDEGN